MPSNRQSAQHGGAPAPRTSPKAGPAAGQKLPTSGEAQSSDGLPANLDHAIASAAARRISPWAVAAILLVVLGVGAGAWFVMFDDSGPTTMEVVIPLGTGERLDNGEDVDVIDKVTEFKVGDSISIDNRDDRAHIVGPLTVTAGESRTYSFAEPGVLEGTCTAHPSGSVTFVVT